MQNLFLVFLVSEKLDAKLRFLKKRFFYRGIKLEIKKERMISNTSYLFKRIK